MGWHDSHIHVFAITLDDETNRSELLLDIDYIFQWNKPVVPEIYYSFFLAPSTLVFHNLFDLTVDLKSSRIVGVDLEIADLNLEESKEKADSKLWKIETQQGDMKFEATGFTQYVRQYPKHVRGQRLSLTERGGISFDKKK